MQARLDMVQSGLNQQSRQALRAAVALEKYTASFPLECQADITAFLSQLKNSLSQLLVLSVSDGPSDHPAEHRAQHTDMRPPPHCYPF